MAGLRRPSCAHTAASKPATGSFCRAYRLHLLVSFVALVWLVLASLALAFWSGLCLLRLHSLFGLACACFACTRFFLDFSVGFLEFFGGFFGEFFVDVVDVGF